jgi:hypothetical protein
MANFVFKNDPWGFFTKQKICGKLGKILVKLKIKYKTYKGAPYISTCLPSHPWKAPQKFISLFLLPHYSKLCH